MQYNPLCAAECIIAAIEQPGGNVKRKMKRSAQLKTRNKAMTQLVK